MSIFTSVWKLLKKNPQTDGNEMFNIETMLNDNWDKIDSALGQKALNADVRAATIASITLNGLQTIDGVVLAAGDRVLVKNQAVGSENGIYLAGSAGWARASDADSAGKLAAGVFVHVKEGIVNGGTGWILTTSGPIELGTTSLVFAQKTGNGSATDAVIGPRTADPNISASYSLSGSVTQLFSWVLKYFKAITGKANPFDAPDITLSSAKAHVDAAAPHSGHAVVERKVNTSGGLQGGGDLSADRTLSIAEAGVTDNHIGTRLIDDSIAAVAGADTPTRLWSKLANMIKAITGKANWWTPPVTTIEALNTNKLNASTYTASDVLTKLKTVDGNGSGLDSDTVDGFHADKATSADTVVVRSPSGNIEANIINSKVADGTAPLSVISKTVVPNLNADMVDGYHLDQDVRTTGEPSFRTVTITQGAQSLIIRPGNLDHAYMAFNPRTSSPGTRGAFVGFGSAGSSIFTIQNEVSSGAIQLAAPNNGYVQSLAPFVMNNIIRMNSIKDTASQWSQAIYFYTTDANATKTTNNYLQVDTANDLKYAKAGGTPQVVWHAGNDGSGSGLDADTIDGRHASEFSPAHYPENYKNGSELPSSYPNKQTTTFFARMDTGGSGWPYPYGTVQTIKGFTNMSAVQFIYPYNSDSPILYRYGLYNNDVWLPWRELATSETAAMRRGSVSEYNIATANTDTECLRANSVAGGNYDVRVYLRVTAAATVSIWLNYTDAGGTVQTTYVVSNSSFSTGSYSMLPLFVNMKNGQNMALLVKSSVANAVKVSASFVGV
ncbi:hypothetical protein H7B90_00470 [Cohnella xylanilytica]|uniref:Tail fiber-like repeat protein n=1 Tax=Cohnella xylanilytica TaxID=557555 RepID=A0A841TW86_9BACL|nr:hypothetical protein [Cohnella xylanilytica]MBB6689864.1 hypothetical protein [Cohnella xylanilytica]